MLIQKLENAMYQFYIHSGIVSLSGIYLDVEECGQAMYDNVQNHCRFIDGCDLDALEADPIFQDKDFESKLFSHFTVEGIEFSLIEMAGLSPDDTFALLKKAWPALSDHQKMLYLNELSNLP